MPMRSPGAVCTGGRAAGFAFAGRGAACLSGALRPGFLARFATGLATFLRIAARFAGTFLRLVFAFAFFLAAM
jgi:hypothetical protein